MLPRVEPVTAPGGGGAGAGHRTAAPASTRACMGRRLDASLAELEIDGLRPYREGTSASRIHWPTVARARRDARAAAGRRARLGAADRARPVRRRTARRGSTRPCAPRRRCASTSAARAAARSCCRATAARSRSATTWPAGPRVHARLALVESGPAPPAVRARPARRRGDLGDRRRPRERPARARADARGRAHRRLAGAAAGRAAAVRGRGLHRLPGRARAARGGGVSGIAAGQRRRAPTPRAAARSRPPARASAALVRLAAFAGAGAVRGGALGRAGRLAAGRAHAAGRAGRHGHRRPARALGTAARATALRPARSPCRAAVLVGLAGLALGLAAVGLPLRLLAPGNWDELFDGLDRGLAGVQTAEWPYAGADSWVRLTTLLGAPLVSASPRCWPSSRPRRAAPLLRVAGAGAAAGASTARRSPSTTRASRCCAAWRCWCWSAPGCGCRGWARARRWPARALVLSLGALSLPVAAASTPSGPGGTTAPGPGSRTTRRSRSTGRTATARSTGRARARRCSNVKSDRPHYWKAETLDTFDGLRWVRGRSSDATQRAAGRPRARHSQDRSWDYFEWNRRWDEEIRFTVRSLSTDLLVVGRHALLRRGRRAGLDGERRHHPHRRRRARGGRQLHRQAPTRPTRRARADARRARTACPGALIQYTSITLPSRASGRPGASATVTRCVPLWGEHELRRPGGAAARARRRRSTATCTGSPRG